MALAECCLTARRSDYPAILCSIKYYIVIDCIIKIEVVIFMAVEVASTVVPENKRLLVAICYIFMWLGGIVIFIIAENNKALKFHALQAIVLGIAVTIVWILLSMILTPLLWSLWSLYNIIWLIDIIIWLYLVYGAYMIYSKGDWQSIVADFVKKNLMT